jgi:hypothetical protein
MPHTFSLLPGEYTLARMDPDDVIPDWVIDAQGFVSITRTGDELSMVCPSDCVPDGVRADGDWRAIKLKGPFAFDQIGVLSSFATPLANAGVGIFAISTFDTDYILVKTHHCSQAIDALRSAGHVMAGNE